MSKPRITEAEAERRADRFIHDLLQTDAAYLNAENSVEQAQREDIIESKVWATLAVKYEIGD